MPKPVMVTAVPTVLSAPSVSETANRLSPPPKKRFVVGGLATVASTLHEKAESLPGGEKVTTMAHSAADKLSATADYVREHDVNSMMADVERLVKNNPGPSLLAAAVVGFLVGRTFSSRD